MGVIGAGCVVVVVLAYVCEIWRCKISFVRRVCCIPSSMVYACNGNMYCHCLLLCFEIFSQFVEVPASIAVS